MSCPKTQHLLQEYFSNDLAPQARDKMERHLSDCSECNAELESLLHAQSHLRDWQEQRVPHWDRGLELFRREHRAPNPWSRVWNWTQWLPTAASLAMLAVLLLNVSIVSGEQGFAISFGAAGAGSDWFETELTTMQTQQRAEMQDLIARVEDRLDNNNVRLLQAVMQQAQQTTAENFEQMYSYFEQQRLLDLQDMRVGYQELVNSDYETIRSLQQLANFVSYQGNVR